jgi:hypothetical protein
MEYALWKSSSSLSVVMADGGRMGALLRGWMGTPAEDMESCVVALAGGVGEARLMAETDAPDEILRKWGVRARSVVAGSTVEFGECGGNLVLA